MHIVPETSTRVRLHALERTEVLLTAYIEDAIHRGIPLDPKTIHAKEGGLYHINHENGNFAVKLCWKIF